MTIASGQEHRREQTAVHARMGWDTCPICRSQSLRCFAPFVGAGAAPRHDHSERTRLFGGNRRGLADESGRAFVVVPQHLCQRRCRRRRWRPRALLGRLMRLTVSSHPSAMLGARAGKPAHVSSGFSLALNWSSALVRAGLRSANGLTVLPAIPLRPLRASGCLRPFESKKSGAPASSKCAVEVGGRHRLAVRANAAQAAQR